MKYGICWVSVAPLREEPSDRAEMVSQLLFGEKVEVKASQGNNWFHVRSSFDGYEGWVDSKQVYVLDFEIWSAIETNVYAKDPFNLAAFEGVPMTLPMGAHLPGKEKFAKIDDFPVAYWGDTLVPETSREQLLAIAYQYINVPYLWGGKSMFGIDCSGFTQQVYKLCGIVLPRDAAQQAEIGEVLSFLEEGQAGDLAFFENEEGVIVHVGILLPENKIIHAHGSVRIDPIDHHGIFNTHRQRHSHKLRFIKRILT